MTQLLRKTTADPVAACSMPARLVKPVLLSCLLLLLPPRTETWKAHHSQPQRPLLTGACNVSSHENHVAWAISGA